MIIIEAEKERKILAKVVCITSLKFITAKPLKTKFNKIVTGMIKPSVNGIKHIKRIIHFLNKEEINSLKIYKINT